MYAIIPEVYLEMVCLMLYLVDSIRGGHQKALSARLRKARLRDCSQDFQARHDDGNALLQKPNAMPFDI